MTYHTLHLLHFRSYAEHIIQFAPGVNIIVGPNGSGKTNLLEALYVLSQGTSFRVSDKDLLQYGAPWFKIEGLYGDQKRVLSFDPARKPPKQFSLDGVKRARLIASQRVPVVLFEPEELRMLHGSPARRRGYIDGLLARLWPMASLLRGRYERALLQRNNILKQAGGQLGAQAEDQLFVWDIKLAEYAAELVQYRLRLVQAWNERLSRVYGAIAGNLSAVQVTYQSSLQTDEYRAVLLRQLSQSRRHDLMRGHTSHGPHRDDFTISLNGVDAAISASRGEARSLILALKLIELDLLESLYDYHPLLLLDDVFSELDVQRRKSLATLAKKYQTVITTTNADIATEYFSKHAHVLQCTASDK